MMTNPQRIVVGISGASGAVYAQRTIELLVQLGIETHVVITPLGQRLLHDELGMEALTDDKLAALAKAESKPEHLILHNYRDVGASIASGSFQHNGMIVIPCSSNSLGAMASGMANNLLHRAAYVTLKERRKLVLVHREMPITSIDIENMKRLSDAGAILAPANPGFYLLPKSIDELVDYVVARCLDLVGVEHQLNVRWTEATTDSEK